MIELIFETLQWKEAHVLKALRTTQMILSREEQHTWFYHVKNNTHDFITWRTTQMTLSGEEQHTIQNTGKYWRSIWFGGIELSQRRCPSLIGMHAFRRNSSKKKKWKWLEKYEKFENCFVNLGLNCYLPHDIFCN